MLKFKIDENLPVEVAGLLASAGHDATTVPEQGMGGQPDSVIADVCHAEARVLMTLDLDFADIRIFTPADYSGLIVLRLAQLDKQSVVRAVQRLVPVLSQELLIGKLWIVEESRVRIRS